VGIFALGGGFRRATGKDTTLELIKEIGSIFFHGFVGFDLLLLRPPLGLKRGLFALGSGRGGGIFSGLNNLLGTDDFLAGEFLKVGKLKGNPSR
jgi:hypothetical protein